MYMSFAVFIVTVVQWFNQLTAVILQTISENLLTGIVHIVCIEYVCPRITHHMLSTLIPLIEVMAVEGTLVSIISLVFLIKEKHKKNCTTTSVSKHEKNKNVNSKYYISTFFN